MISKMQILEYSSICYRTQKQKQNPDPTIHMPISIRLDKYIAVYSHNGIVSYQQNY